MTTNPINRACISNNLDILKQTVAVGHKPDMYSLDYSINTCNPEFVQIVCGIGASPSSSTLSRACQVGNEVIVQYAMASGAQPDSETLTHALNSKNQKIIQIVSDLGATPNDESLLSAIQAGNYTFVKTAVSSVKDVNEQLKKISWVSLLQKGPIEGAARYAMTCLIENGATFPPLYSSRFSLVKALAQNNNWSDKFVQAKLASQADYRLISQMLEAIANRSELCKNSQHISGKEFHKRHDAYTSQIDAIYAIQPLFDQQPYEGSLANRVKIPAPKAGSGDDSCLIA